MAHQTPIARWVLNNRDRLRPSFIRYDWPDRYFSGVTDFAAKISFGGIEAIGRGIDFDQDLALEKAAAEAVERYICKMLNLDSVGVAISGEAGSVSHAEHEAIERHIFNEHLRLNLPFEKIDDRSTGSPALREIQNEFDRHNKHEGQLSFYRMATASPYRGYVAIICIGEKPRFLGLSLHTNSRSALFRSFFEAMTNFARFRDAPEALESERRLEPDAWNCDPAFLARVIAQVGTTAEPSESIPIPQLETVAIDISQIAALKGCPIKPVKAFTRKTASP